MMRRRGGLVRGVARTAVVAGTATAVSGRVARRQNNKWAEKDQAQYEEEMAQQPAPAPASAPGGGGEVDELKQIAELHDQGILTDEEFTAKKAQILGI